MDKTLSYNETFYPAVLQESKENLKKLLKVQQMLLKFLVDFLDSASDVMQKNHFPEFLKLIATIRLNIESVNILIPMLYDDYRFKTSVNIIYRSIISDLITLNYLKGFIDDADEHQVSLGNELNIFNKEYLLSTYEALLAENEYNISNYVLTNQPVKDELRAIESRNSTSGMMDDNGKWKFNSSLRSTTNLNIVTKLKTALVKDSNKGFISENEKIRFLKEMNSDYYLQLKFVFKYYSQFQHFSPSTADLVHDDIDYAYNTYKTSIYLLIRFLKDSLIYFNVKDYDLVVNEFLSVVHLYNETFA